MTLALADPGWLVAVFLQGTVVLAIGVCSRRAGALRALKPGILLGVQRLIMTVVCLLPVLALLGWGLPGNAGLPESAVFQWIETVTPQAQDRPLMNRGEPAETPYLRILLLLAVAGVVVRCLRIALGRLRLGRFRRGAKPWKAPWVEAWCGKLRLPTRVESLLSPDASAPLTFGWLRPVIVLPESFIGLQREQQQAVLCHELLHVQRRDWLVASWEQVMTSIWWFHPWMKSLSEHIQLLREQVVDAAAVARLGNRRVYLETLLLFKKSEIGPSVGLDDAALAFQSSHLFRRVEHLTEEKKMSQTRTTVTTTGLVTLLGMALFLALASFPAVADGSASAGLSLAGEPIHTTDEPGIVKPVRLLGDQPAYPEMPKEDRIEGIVIVETVVNSVGELEQTKILKPLGEKFDQAVLDVLPDWRFNPATLNGKSVPVKYHLTFNFRLDDNKS